MSSPTLPPALLDGRAPDGGRAFLWLLGCLATAIGILGSAALISSESEREAGRLLTAAESGPLAVLAVAYAGSHGRPHRR